MDTFWHIVGYIALAVLGFGILGFLVLWAWGKMMSDTAD